MSLHVPTDRLPREGNLLAVSVDGTAVALARVDGAVYAFQDECTHQACSLSLGDVEGHHVVCPCHLGTFDVVSGDVVSGPPKAALRTWAVTAHDGGVELAG